MIARNLLDTLFGAAIGLVGVTFIGVAARNWRLVAATRRWSITGGTIISARLDARDPIGLTWAEDLSYFPVVEYEYVVNGVRYSADRLSVWDTSYKRPEAAAEALSRFPAGADVTVYFDPERPETSVLVPGGSRVPSVVSAIVGAVCLFFAALVLHLLRWP